MEKNMSNDINSNENKKKNNDYGLLTLTVRLGDVVIIGDSSIILSELKNKSVRLTFNAPKSVKINRTNRVDIKNK
jgi:hypothetical protein